MSISFYMSLSLIFIDFYHQISKEKSPDAGHLNKFSDIQIQYRIRAKERPRGGFDQCVREQCLKDQKHTIICKKCKWKK